MMRTITYCGKKMEARSLTTNHSIEERIGRMNVCLMRMKCALVLLLLLFGVSVLVAMQPDPASAVLRCGRLEILSPSGHESIVLLGHDEGGSIPGPLLRMGQEGSQASVRIGIAKLGEGPYVQMNDGSGRVRAGVWTETGAASGLVLEDGRFDESLAISTRNGGELFVVKRGDKKVLSLRNGPNKTMILEIDGYVREEK